MAPLQGLRRRFHERPRPHQPGEAVGHGPQREIPRIDVPHQKVVGVQQQTLLGGQDVELAKVAGRPLDVDRDAVAVRN